MKHHRTKHGGAFVTICVSTYPEDLARLDALVRSRRARGERGVSRSSVIREAVAILAGVSRLSGALALIHARPTGAVVVLRLTPAVDRAHVACVLSQALLSAGSSHVRAIHLAAEHVRPLLLDLAPCTMDDRARQLRRAIELRDRVTELQPSDRTPVLVAVIRSLLDGAPDVCERLDRAVRDAALAHDHAVTEAHERAAERALEG